MSDLMSTNHHGRSGYPSVHRQAHVIEKSTRGDNVGLGNDTPKNRTAAPCLAANVKRVSCRRLSQREPEAPRWVGPFHGFSCATE